jgi:hypothetical protein
MNFMNFLIGGASRKRKGIRKERVPDAARQGYSIGWGETALIPAGTKGMKRERGSNTYLSIVLILRDVVLGGVVGIPLLFSLVL